MRIARYSIRTQDTKIQTGIIGAFLTLFSFLPLAKATVVDADRATGLRFHSRLHEELDRQLGWEFPLWMDNESRSGVGESNPSGNQSESDFSTAVAKPAATENLAVSNSTESESLSNFEWEIIRSVQEIYRISESEALAAYRGELTPENRNQPVTDGSWAVDRWLTRIAVIPQDLLVVFETFPNSVFPQIEIPAWVSPQFSVPTGIKRGEVVGLVARYPGTRQKQFQSILPASRYSPVLHYSETANEPTDGEKNFLNPIIPLERPLFEEVFTWFQRFRLKEPGGREFVVLGSEQWFETAEWANELWGTLASHGIVITRWPAREVASEPALEPTPTASYVGLEPALLWVGRYVTAVTERLERFGQDLAVSARRLPSVQNGTLERMVLEQFDAIRR